MRRGLWAAVMVAVALVLFAVPAHAIESVSPPVAGDDSYSVAHNQQLDVAAPGVLANDSDPQGLPLTVSSYTPAVNGTSWMLPSGAFGWRPPAGFVGNDVMTYAVFNGVYQAIGTITLTATNAEPVVNGDAFSVHAGGQLVVYGPGLLGNDVDPDGDVITSGLLVNSSHGETVVYADGSFIYTPSFSYIGQDSFWYWAYDFTGAYGIAMVTIDVTNTPPVAIDQAYDVGYNEALTVPPPGLFTGAYDPEGDPLFAFIAEQPTHGTLDYDEFSGQFSYTPDTDYSGPDSFQFFVSDYWVASDIHKVDLNVLGPPNQAPVAGLDGPYSVVHGQTLTIDAPGVLANDSDPDGDPLTITMNTSSVYGTVTLAPDGSFQYEAPSWYSGPDSFVYGIEDPSGALAYGTVYVDITDQAPLAVDQEYSVVSGNSLTSAAPGFLTGASDPDSDAISGVMGIFPAHGSLVWDVDGSFTYTPYPGFVGDDAFQFAAHDGAMFSDLHPVTIHVLAADQPPVAVADTYTARKNNVLTVGAAGVLGNDHDPNGDAMTAVKVSNPAHGTLVFNANGSFTYTPTRGYTGLDRFTYKVLANGAYSNTVTVSINVIVPKK